MGIVAAAGIGAAGSIFGGIMSASGSAKSAAATIKAAEIASKTAMDMNNLARRDVAPFRQMGVDAGKTMMGLLLGRDNYQSTLKASPLFEFQSEMGSRNINRELSARGLFGSGAGLETLQRFNNQLVGEEGERIFSRLFGVTQLGANAANHQANITNQTGQTVAGIQANAGVQAGQAYANQYNAIGQSIQGGFNAIRGGIGDYVQQQMYQPLMQRLAGGGGFGGAQTSTYGGSTGFNVGGAQFLVNSPSFGWSS